MYTLNVKNNYIWPISTSDAKHIAAKGGSATFQKQGSIILEVPGMGAFNFIDIAAERIPGYPNPQHWGVLVRTHTIEAYYRYEGAGELTATFDQFGTCSLSTTNGSLIPISLPELIVNGQGVK